MAFFKRKRSHSEILSERERLTAEKAEAQKRLDNLIETRRDVELYGELDDLQRHDAELAKQRLTIDRANARLTQIDSDEWALAAEAEQARRQAVYDAAQKAHAEGRSALRDYEKFAASAGEALKRYATAKAAIDAANDNLPDGKPAIEDCEPNNSVPFYGPKPKPALSWDWGKGESHNHELPRPAKPHLSILTRAVFPRLGEREGYYFGAENAAKKIGYYNR